MALSIRTRRVVSSRRKRRRRKARPHLHHILRLTLPLVLIPRATPIVPQSDNKKKQSKKKKTKKSSSDDKPSAAAKSKSRKEKKVQKLTNGLEEPNKAMIEMAAELRELRGIPAAIQKTFDNQCSEAKGSEPAPEPLLTLSQWKALQETNKKERSRPATPVKKPWLFTAACEKVRLTPRQILAPSPKQASTTTSVSSDCAGVLAAVESSLKEADQVTHLSLSSGFAMPIEAE